MATTRVSINFNLLQNISLISLLLSQTPTLSLSLDDAFAHLLPTSSSTPKGNCLPVHATLPGDVLTPVLAYLRLTDGAKSGESFLMESVVRGETTGRWSYVGASESV